MADKFDALLADMPQDLADALRPMIVHPFDGYLSPTQVDTLQQASGLEARELLLKLLPVAATFARPPVSDFHVGAIVRGESGALYIGANMELAGEALFHSVHAEQAAISHAWLSGESAIQDVVVNASPCGHCRQFMNEITSADKIQIVLPGQAPAGISHYLPFAFGPKDLGIESGLMTAPPQPLHLDSEDPLVTHAVEQARQAYAPYSKSPSAVVLETRDGRHFCGRYAENAAFNPSLPPMQMALSTLSRHQVPASEIARAVLVQKKGGQIDMKMAAADALATVCDIELEVHYAD